MYKHSNVGDAHLWDNDQAAGTAITTAIGLTGSLVGDFAPQIPTAYQTAAEQVDCGYHIDFASAETIGAHANTAICARLNTADNVTQGQIFMIEFSGVAQISSSAARFTVYPYVAVEKTAITLDGNNWASNQPTNPFTLVPVDAFYTTTGNQSASWRAKVLVRAVTNANDNFNVVVLYHNGSSGSEASVYELNGRFHARFAIEKIATYEREF